MKKIQKLGADRLRVLKALVDGGRVEKRRCYPYPDVFHLVKPDDKNPAPKVSELVMTDLTSRGFIAPTKAPNLSKPGSTDTMDFVITLAGTRAAQLKGVEYEDTQESLLDESTGKYDEGDRTGMETA